MTTPVEEIQVECPGCGHVYKDWRRPSINFNLGEEFREEYIDQATSATCPKCGLKVYFTTLFVRDKTFTFKVGDDVEGGDKEDS